MILLRLSQLPLDDRSALILEAGQKDLEAVLLRLREQGAAIPAAMDPERLAWAVAFNVNGLSAPGSPATAAAYRAVRGYRDHWPPDAAWTAIWSILTKPREPDSTTLLGELALSVACEQRDEWQNGAAGPLDVAEANRAFDFVYARNRHKVVGHVLGRFGDRAGSPEVIAAEAWSRVFCDYWSSRARRRFLGLSRISTLVCQVAHHVAFDELRGAGELVTRDGEEDPGLRRVAVVIDHPDAAMDCEDPEARVVAEQLQARIRECLALVPPKQQIVATLVWIRQIQAKRVAEMLGVSDPAISQHLKKARDAIRTCLEAHGFDVPRGVAARKKTTALQ